MKVREMYSLYMLNHWIADRSIPIADLQNVYIAYCTLRLKQMKLQPPLSTSIIYYVSVNIILCVELESNHSSQVPPPRQCYSLGGVTIFALPAVSLMPPLTQW